MLEKDKTEEKLESPKKIQNIYNISQKEDENNVNLFYQ